MWKQLLNFGESEVVKGDVAVNDNVTKDDAATEVVNDAVGADDTVNDAVGADDDWNDDGAFYDSSNAPVDTTTSSAPQVNPFVPAPATFKVGRHGDLIHQINKVPYQLSRQTDKTLVPNEGQVAKLTAQPDISSFGLREIDEGQFGKFETHYREPIDTVNATQRNPIVNSGNRLTPMRFKFYEDDEAPSENYYNSDMRKIITAAPQPSLYNIDGDLDGYLSNIGYGVKSGVHGNPDKYVELPPVNLKNVYSKLVEISSNTVPPNQIPHNTLSKVTSSRPVQHTKDDDGDHEYRDMTGARANRDRDIPASIFHGGDRATYKKVEYDLKDSITPSSTPTAPAVSTPSYGTLPVPSMPYAYGMPYGMPMPMPYGMPMPMPYGMPMPMPYGMPMPMPYAYGMPYGMPMPYGQYPVNPVSSNAEDKISELTDRVLSLELNLLQYKMSDCLNSFNENYVIRELKSRIDTRLFTVTDATLTLSFTAPSRTGKWTGVETNRRVYGDNLIDFNVLANKGQIKKVDTNLYTSTFTIDVLLVLKKEELVVIEQCNYETNSAVFHA
jgi:hypothetical protein